MLKQPETSLLLSLLLALALAPPALAQQQREVEQVTPRGGSRGATVEVLIRGMDIADPRQVLFARPGIKATGFEVLPPLEHPIGLNHRGQIVEQVRARFAIDPDCPLGEHPFRLLSANNLSTLATFWVGPFPTVDERERSAGDNDAPEKAEPVPLNTTVAGLIHEGRKLDRDLYRVSLKKGQPLGVEVESMRLSMMGYGGSEYDLVATILDRAGKTLARDDDNGLHIQDPVLSLVAPDDGDYLVEVRQRVYRPHQYGHYRLHLGDFPRPMAAYPLGGKAGRPLSVRLLGDAAGPTMQDVAVPESPGTFDLYPGPAGHQAPSPLKLRSSPYENVLEVESEVTPAPAPPIALNGLIEVPGDVDTFRLPLKKGQAVRVRVFAGTLGTPLDPRIEIKGADGPTELAADDATLADRDLFGLSNDLRPRDLLDPSVVFTPGRDGDYLINLADTRGMGGPTSAYRVEVEPISDSIITYVKSTAHDAFETNRVTGFIVPRGNRWTLNVLIGKGQGTNYEGDLDLAAVGLPPGVTMEAPRVTRGMNVVPVQFLAAEDAPEAAANFAIHARPVDPKVAIATGSKQGFSFLNQSGGHAFHSVALDHFSIGVTRPAPFRVELVPPRVPLVQGGELALDVKIDRRVGFDEPVDVAVEWLPVGLAGESSVTISPGQTEGRFAIHANGNAPPGRHRIAINATTTGGLAYCGVGRIRTSSHFVDLVITAPYLTLTLKRAAIERGGRAALVAEVNHRRPLPGKVTAILKRLPGGVNLDGPPVVIRDEDKEIRFPIAASLDALVGSYAGIVCELTVEEDCQAVRQQAGSGTLRVDPARGRSTDATP